jgi:hypothetical protein
MVSFANRVRVSTATTGTGTIILGSAQTGYASFAEGGIANGATVGYCIEDGNNFEVGRGTYNSSLQTLTRTVLLSKLNDEAASSSPLSLSGSAKVFVTAVAEDIVNPDLAIVDLLGINATPDATNKLSVNSPAVLLNHAGSNSQVKVNKAAAGDTASFLFQDNFSTRAEVGLVGNDDFQFKVSPDGSTFYTGISIDKDDGVVSIPIRLVPAADDGAALGSAGTAWADLFLASGGTLNWNAGDVTVTHAANALAFAGASIGYSFDAVITPAAQDGAAIGSASLMWSDLFLASGGVINWNNGDVTITHSSNFLNFSGADGGYAFSSDQGNGTTIVRAFNSSNASTTTKLAAFQYVGVDTVGTVKETGRITCSPGDSDLINSTIIFYSRQSNVVTIALQIGTEVTSPLAIKSTSATGGVGYATGAGGAVTQITSKSTTVTLNTVCGQIATHNASLGAGASVVFNLQNSTIAASDFVGVSIQGGGTANVYTVSVVATGAGGANIRLTNTSGGALGEAVIINFAVIKAVAS